MVLKITSIPALALLLALLIPENSSPKKADRIDTQITMCHATTQAFANLANDQEFINIHEDPIPFNDFQPVGEMITYEVNDGKTANAYFIKSKVPSNDYLFVVHEWYGLNNYVKNESGKFYTRFPEMNVIALDIYDGKVAENSEEASKYMQSVKTERALAIINGAKKFVGKDANIYTVGWCFGGGWSLQTAIEAGDQAKACVMFYGMPETNMDRLKTLKCDVLAIFANQDKWITPEVAATFEKNMSQMDNKLIVKAYDADHGFANPSNPKFNEKAAESAYKEMFSFVKKRR